MMGGDNMVTKFVHAQTILEVDKLDELKSKTGEHTTKEAIGRAIDHYLTCEITKVKK